MKAEMIKVVTMAMVMSGVRDDDERDNRRDDVGDNDDRDDRRRG